MSSMEMADLNRVIRTTSLLRFVRCIFMCTHILHFFFASLGDDATDMFCRWCANGGNLYCCSYCSNTFCYKCIKINFSPSIRQKIEADEKWKCFVCDPSELTPARAVYWGLQQHIQTLLGYLFLLNHNFFVIPLEQ